MCVCVCSYLGRCGVLPVLQGQRLQVRAAPQAPEGHAGAQRADVAHADHRPPHGHQPAEHAGAQRPQSAQRLVVVEPGSYERERSRAVASRRKRSVVRPHDLRVTNGWTRRLKDFKPRLQELTFSQISVKTWRGENMLYLN